MLLEAFTQLRAKLHLQNKLPLFTKVYVISTTHCSKMMCLVIEKPDPQNWNSSGFVDITISRPYATTKLTIYVIFSSKDSKASGKDINDLLFVDGLEKGP